jgi:hypothetical protein
MTYDVKIANQALLDRKSIYEHIANILRLRTLALRKFGLSGTCVQSQSACFVLSIRHSVLRLMPRRRAAFD